MAPTQSKLGEVVFAPQSSDEDKYERMGRIGQGSFGEVFKGRIIATDQMVALKRALPQTEEEEMDDMPISTHREIKCLQRLHCDNVVRLLAVYQEKDSQEPHKESTILVMEFCLHDLDHLLKSAKFSQGEIKAVIRQIFDGLFFVHFRKILHRDIKPSNILINSDGVVKIGDFGLARDGPAPRPAEEAPCFTNPVVSLWYRSPELLLGARDYAYPVDIWAAGCIFAQLWTRKPVLKGRNNLKQLQLISKLCGSITPEVWEDVEQCPLYKAFQLPRDEKRKLTEKLQGRIKDPLALDLLDKLLTLNPAHRESCEGALMHDYFMSDPTAADLRPLVNKAPVVSLESLTLQDRASS